MKYAVQQVIDEQGLTGYERVIPGDLYELLSETAQERALAQQYLCIGVRQEDVAVAALILELEEYTGDLVILSLYVAPEHRRQGIATQMLHQALETAAEGFVFSEGADEESVRMKMNSLLPEDAHDIWHAFLASVGFMDFTENPASYALKLQDLKRVTIFEPVFDDDYKPAAQYMQVSELSDEEQQELLDVVMEEYTPYYSMVSGSQNARKTAVVIDQVDVDIYQVLLADQAPDTSEQEMVEALNAVLRLIYTDAGEFTLLVRENAGAAEPLLRRALADDSQMLIEEQGWMDVVFRA